ncbi:DUF3244 domain-containing protein [Phocaeicola sp.]|uniref:DUF3244 domain-containing protein n=1 Tax=Phocaeicola sp. TaxID=2773926 RepID=UPI0023D7A3F2|nr:DUF3244 domain-containing protein [Phocaeicola sp.]MDE5676254.1 DUF3244 domain-containing protein [Phocaeicola sp.]
MIVKTRSVHVALIASIVICFLFISKSYSSIYENQKIDVKGDWSTEEVTERSLPTIPITVYLWNNYINVQNNKPDCDITVSITSLSTGEAVYQQTILKVETSNVLIPIGSLASGEYRIELTGPGTRYLEGTFRK